MLVRASKGDGKREYVVEVKRVKSVWDLRKVAV